MKCQTNRSPNAILSHYPCGGKIISVVSENNDPHISNDVECIQVALLIFYRKTTGTVLHSYSYLAPVIFAHHSNNRI
jgi:hypothetical protein